MGVRVYIFRFNTESYGKKTVLGDFRLPGTQPETLAGVCGQAKCQSNKKPPSLSKPSLGVGSHSLRAYCRLPREINAKDSDRSMEFISFYIFKWHHGDEMRIKHYAGILLIEFRADLIYEYGYGKSGRVLTRYPLGWRQRWRVPRGRHVTIYIKYIRFYLFIYRNGAQMML